MLFSFWWIVAAVLVFWVIGAHNRLVRLRAAVRVAFANLHLTLQQWIQLVGTFPTMADAATPMSVAAAAAAVNTVQGPDTRPTSSSRRRKRKKSASSANVASSQETPARLSVSDLARSNSVARSTAKAPTWLPIENPVEWRANAAGLAAAARQLESCANAMSARPLDRNAAEAVVAAMHAMRSSWDRKSLDDHGAGNAPDAGYCALWIQQDTLTKLGCTQFNDTTTQYNAALLQFPARILGWLLRFQPAGHL